MLSEDQVIEILDGFKAYSVAQQPDFESHFISLMSPLYSAVERYFSTKHPEIEEKLRELVHNMYCDILERGTVMEFTYGDPLPTDFPETYHDLEKCFYEFDLGTEVEFHNAWVIGIPTDENGLPIGTEEIPLSNSLVSLWTAELTSAKATEVTKVSELLAWIQNSSSTNNLPYLLEDTGRVISSPSMQGIAKDIYISKGLLEIIKTLTLNVYIPSYLR